MNKKIDNACAVNFIGFDQEGNRHQVKTLKFKLGGFNYDLIHQEQSHLELEFPDLFIVNDLESDEVFN